MTTTKRGAEPHLVASAVLAVDPIVFTVAERQLQVVLWQRAFEPMAGQWALPGVFYNPGEGLEGAARRGLHAKAHVHELRHMEQLATWDHADRDPRGSVIEVSYYGLQEARSLRDAIGGHADVCLAKVIVPWTEETGGRVHAVDGADARIDLAFDHDELIGLAVKRLRGKLHYTGQAVHLLPGIFTLRELQQVYEAVLGRPVNKDSFRRSVTQTHRLVEPTGTYTTVEGTRRAAEQYRPVKSHTAL